MFSARAIIRLICFFIMGGHHLEHPSLHESLLSYYYKAIRNNFILIHDRSQFPPEKTTRRLYSRPTLIKISPGADQVSQINLQVRNIQLSNRHIRDIGRFLKE